MDSESFRVVLANRDIVADNGTLEPGTTATHVEGDDNAKVGFGWLSKNIEAVNPNKLKIVSNYYELNGGVLIAWSTVTHEYGKLEGKSADEKKQAIIELVKNMHHGSNTQNYFWLHTYDKNNPAKPVLIYPNFNQLS